VEVLRGPQGTLYGASSLGGLLKFVTVDPSVQEFSGRVQAGVSNVRESGDVGYSVRGAVNVPLSDTVAIRASGFTRQDPGYVDNVVTGAKDVNTVDVNGGRLSALFQPSDAFSVKLSALIQRTESDGLAEIVGVGLGDLQSQVTPGLGGYDQDIDAYTAVVKGQVGRVDLTSITGYNRAEFSDAKDFRSFHIAILDHFRTRRFTQEVRASLPLGASVDWLIGGYYTHEKNDPKVQDVQLVDPITNALSRYSIGEGTSTFSEYAVLTDLTFKISDRFDVQVGARQSEIDQAADDVNTNALSGIVVVTPHSDISASSFTYLLTPRFRISPDLMVYARFASGYRPGGPNANSITLGLPASFAPDKTQNYEVGMKGNVMDGAVSFDASVYYIDWKDLQLNLCRNTDCYFTNAGRAKSQGIELSVEARPLSGTRISGWVAYSKAELTENFPTGSAFGRKGDQLPYGARYSGSVSLDQSFPLAADVLGFVGLTTSYIDDRKDVFSASATRNTFPGYVQTDVRAGASFGDWSANIFANNVADRRGVLAGNPASGGVIYIQPRTIGVSVARSF
jgi:outer membrane receptor protein involved in Fe transport